MTHIDNDELLRFADMPDGLSAEQMEGFRIAAILANKRFDRTVAEAEKETWQEAYEQGYRDAKNGN